MERETRGPAFRFELRLRSSSVSRISFIQNGAGNEIRTRDPDLGKVVLYQLSYSRLICAGDSIPGFGDKQVHSPVKKWRPLGESNPCCRDENPVS